MSEFVVTDGAVPQGYSTGLVPRNYETHPVGYNSKPFQLKLIPESEWQNHLDVQKASRAQLSNVRRRGKNGGIMPSTDQGSKGYCVLAGTLIRMADGTQKSIEKIQLLEPVVTAEGNIGRVMQLHVREHSGDLVTIEAWGHSHLKMTPNHRVLTKRGYVAAGELTTEDWIIEPRYAPESVSIVQTASHVAGVKRRIKDVVGKATFETRMPNANDIGCNHLPDFIDLTPGVGRIFGLWIAEGHIDSSGSEVIWSFNITETDTLVAELVGLLESEWGMDARVKPAPGPNCIQVSIQGKMWQQLFSSLCGKLAGSKQIHTDLMSGPPEFLKALLSGWMDGDGCERHTEGRAVFLRGATVSHTLALNMFDIANHLGMAQVNKYAKTRKPVWKITIIPNPSTYRPNYRASVETTKTWRKVHNIQHEAYTGTVYNIGVEGDNSYIAEGIGVHNCWAHSTTSAELLSRAFQNEPYADLSAYAVACVIKGYRDQGGWGAESLEFVAKNGIPTSEFWPQRSMSRDNDTPAMRANASKHKITEWMDLEPRNKAQVVTCLLLNIPVVIDLNWWGHSVCAMDIVSFNPFRIKIWNSWGDQWGDQGEGILEGNKAIPDGAIAPFVTMGG